MKRIRVWLLLGACAAVAPAAAQQAFTGRLSDSTCGASHQARAAAGGLTDRQCLLACIKALSKYVVVDPDDHVVAIANQDAMGLPLYAGRPVKLTGSRNGDSIVVTKVEAIAAHLHVGHVMTNWRDTPGSRGFLPVAIDEARVAILHAGLAAKSSSLEDVKLHAGHVLHALDPAVEPKGPPDSARGGPAAGYGVKKATAGALQHLELAAAAEGATASVKTHGSQVSAILTGVQQQVDRAIAAAQKVVATTSPEESQHGAADLVDLVKRIGDDLRRAEAEMNLMLKAEGLLGAPR